MSYTSLKRDLNTLTYAIRDAAVAMPPTEDYPGYTAHWTDRKGLLWLEGAMLESPVGLAGWYNKAHTGFPAPAVIEASTVNQDVSDTIAALRDAIEALDGGDQSDAYLAAANTLEFYGRKISKKIMESRGL